jgi:holo-[acyl-carrier protein] synthase
VSFAVGIDQQPFAEVEESLGLFGDRYTRLIYTPTELQRAHREPDHVARQLAALFATKEAVMKVLAPDGDVPTWLDIEVGRPHDGTASVALHGVAATLAQRQGIAEISVSLDTDARWATAIAVAQRSNVGVMQ